MSETFGGTDRLAPSSSGLGDPDAVESPPRLADSRRAALAVFASFGQGGLVFSSWASRIPQVRGDLALSTGSLGLILSAVAVGSTVSIPLSAMVIRRLGEARVVSATSLVMSIGLGIVALAANLSAAWLAVGLALMGFGSGFWDVALNVQGSAVEQKLGRSMLARFYAGSSVGTALGAAIGFLMVYLGVPLDVHLGGIALLMAVTAPLVARSFLAPVQTPTNDSRAPRPRRDRPWMSPRILMLGLLVLCMALSEGAGNDWLGVSMVDGYAVSNQAGTATFAAFLIAMTCGRWFGPIFIDRFGRAHVLVAVVCCGVAGLTLVVFGGAFPIAFCGALLWGMGTSLGMPIGLSAASSGPDSTGSVTVVASIGYVAFLGGPPLIGFLADLVGPLRALLLIEVMFIVALCMVRSAGSEPTNISP